MSHHASVGFPRRPVVGMAGAGHIAHMMHEAAVDLGIDLVTPVRWTREAVFRAGVDPLDGHPDEFAVLERLADQCNVITGDSGHVPSPLALALADQGYRIFPRGEALAVAQDTLGAWRVLGSSGFRVPAFAVLGDDPRQDINRFAAMAGWPVVLKARTGGDDRVVAIATRLQDVPSLLEFGDGDLWVEESVEASREVALVGVRSPSGRWIAYPLLRRGRPTLVGKWSCRRRSLLIPLLKPKPSPRRSPMGLMPWAS